MRFLRVARAIVQELRVTTVPMAKRGHRSSTEKSFSTHTVKAQLQSNRDKVVKNGTNERHNLSVRYESQDRQPTFDGTGADLPTLLVSKTAPAVRQFSSNVTQPSAGLGWPAVPEASAVVLRTNFYARSWKVFFFSTICRYLL